MAAKRPGASSGVVNGDILRHILAGEMVEVWVLLYVVTTL
jgi:hypothetical protein